MSKESESFKRGMVAGVKPLSEKFEEFKNEYMRMNHITQENQLDLSRLMKEFIKKLNEFERKEILGLSNNNVLSLYNDNEKSILVNAIYTLMNQSNESQKKYYSNLQKSLGIDNPNELTDISQVEHIESDEKQYEFLMIILEFGYLQYHSFDFLEDSHYASLLYYIKHSEKDLIELKEKIEIRYNKLGEEFFCDRFLEKYYDDFNVSTEDDKAKEKPFDCLKKIVDGRIGKICDSSYIVTDKEKIKELAYDYGYPALNSILGCIHIKLNKLKIKTIEDVTIIFTTRGMWYRNKEYFTYVVYKDIEDREYSRINNDEKLKLTFIDSFSQEKSNIVISHKCLYESELSILLEELKNKIEEENYDIDDRIHNITDYDLEVRLLFAKLMINYIKECNLPYGYIMFVLSELNLLEKQLLRKCNHYFEDNLESDDQLIELINQLVDENSKASVFTAFMQMCIFVAYLEDKTLKNERFDYINRLGNKLEFDKDTMATIHNYSSLLLKIAYDEISLLDYKEIASKLHENIEKSYISLEVILGYKEAYFSKQLILHDSLTNDIKNNIQKELGVNLDFNYNNTLNTVSSSIVDTTKKHPIVTGVTIGLSPVCFIALTSFIVLQSPIFIQNMFSLVNKNRIKKGLIDYYKKSIDRYVQFDSLLDYKSISELLKLKDSFK
ncbi:MAG: hypothetical protein KHZ15_01950 [Coprobacillus cateniformis]|uniref:hypothetical protein n=1 Tax=Longibaculum muris TaxID=1796628 RepID=UPI003AB7712F|nr:hypothetical protein [Coprobacillus cateniformis]